MVEGGCKYYNELMDWLNGKRKNKNETNTHDKQLVRNFLKNVE